MIYGVAFLAFLFVFSVSGGLFHGWNRRLQDENDAVEYARRNSVVSIGGKGKTQLWANKV